MVLEWDGMERRKNCVLNAEWNGKTPVDEIFKAWKISVRIWYIPGKFFFRYKTISYHTTTQQVCIILIFLLIFALFNLPQSFHCHLRRALRVDSAGLNTKIRQLDTIYICFAMRSVWHGVVRLCMPIDIYSKCENSLSPILI